MKVAQYAICGIFLTLTAAAQTATPPSAPASATPPAAAAKPHLTTLGGDAVKGPEHPITAEQAKTLYEAMGYQKWLDHNLETMIASGKARNPMVPVAFWDDLNSSFGKIDYATIVFDVYKQYLSTEDAAKLIEFSKTEAGKHYFESVPATSQEVQQAIQRTQGKIGQETQMRHKDEIQAAIKKYQEEHAPKPAPTLGSPTPAAPSGSTAPAATPAAPAPATPAPATPAPTTPPASTSPQH
jgi:hypothetical protein